MACLTDIGAHQEARHKKAEPLDFSGQFGSCCLSRVHDVRSLRGVFEKYSTGFRARSSSQVVAFGRTSPTPVPLPCSQSVLILTSYTPPITTNSSSPFNIPGSNRLKKKIFGKGTSAIRM